MTEIQFPESAHQIANDVLVWIGFGTVVGLVAKALMPGRDPGGSIATLMMGIGGSVIGCGTLTFFYDGYRVTPLSGPGFVTAVVGAFILLCFYRLLGGYFFIEGEHVSRVHRRRRRRRSLDPIYED